MALQQRRRKQAAHVSVSGRVLTIRHVVNGRRIRERHEYGSEREASKMETLVRRNLADGLPPYGVEHGPAWGVAEVLKAYRPPGRGEGGVSSVSLDRIEHHNAHLIRLLGGAGSVEKMVPDDLYAFQAARRAEKVSTATVARDLGHLRAACRAAKVNRRIAGHPFELLDRQARRSLLPQSEPKGREIPDAELERIMANVAASCCGVLRFIRATGITRGTACLRLTWENVTRSAIEIPRPTKKRAPISIPISIVKDLLPPRPIGGRGPIFPVTTGALGSAWDRARKKAGSNARIHEIGKHSAITGMARLGVPVEDIAAATGTRAETIRHWYLHATKERGSSAFERLAAGQKADAAKRALIGQQESGT